MHFPVNKNNTKITFHAPNMKIPAPSSHNMNINVL